MSLGNEVGDIEFGVNEDLFLPNDQKRVSDFFEQFILSVGDLIAEYQRKTDGSEIGSPEKSFDGDFLLKDGDLISCRSGMFSAKTPVSSIDSVVKFAMSAALISDEKRLFVRCPSSYKEAFAKAAESLGVQLIISEVQPKDLSLDAPLELQSGDDAASDLAGFGELLSPSSAHQDISDESIPSSVRVTKNMY